MDRITELETEIKLVNDYMRMKEEQGNDLYYTKGSYVLDTEYLEELEMELKHLLESKNVVPFRYKK